MLDIGFESGISSPNQSYEKSCWFNKIRISTVQRMAAFAQFGSDLDVTTQKLLNRGSKLTELLKQDQYSPMTVAQQVIAVFSGVRGFLDKMELSEIKSFEKQVYEEIKSSNQEIIDSINNTGKLEEKIEKKLTLIIEQFQKKSNK